MSDDLFEEGGEIEFGSEGGAGDRIIPILSDAIGNDMEDTNADVEIYVVGFENGIGLSTSQDVDHEMFDFAALEAAADETTPDATDMAVFGDGETNDGAFGTPDYHSFSPTGSGDMSIGIAGESLFDLTGSETSGDYNLVFSYKGATGTEAEFFFVDANGIKCTFVPDSFVFDDTWQTVSVDISATPAIGAEVELENGLTISCENISGSTSSVIRVDLSRIRTIFGVTLIAGEAIDIDEVILFAEGEEDDQVYAVTLLTYWPATPDLGQPQDFRSYCRNRSSRRTLFHASILCNP